MMKEVTPPEASNLLKNNPDAVLLDVRSSMEYEYVGHPVGAVHVPIKEPPDWQQQAGFVDNVKRIIAENGIEKAAIETRPVLLLCRSGKRSELAASLLIDAGFSDVYNILEGFEGDKDENGHRNTINGWRFHKLPWQQS